MLRRYARRLRRRTLVNMRATGGAFIDSEAAKPLAVLTACVLVAHGSGAGLGKTLPLLGVAAVLCAAWWLFILRQWWIVASRFHDRRYRLFTRKRLPREYRGEEGGARTGRRQ